MKAHKGQNAQVTVYMLFDRRHLALVDGKIHIPQRRCLMRQKAKQHEVEDAGGVSKCSAAITGIAISTNIKRWIADSFGPAVFAILDARWQSQSAKPVASQRGSTKYINT
jgi:hypothetical protein